MHVTIDKRQCIGCGLCEQQLPEVFIMQNQKALVKESPVKEELRFAVSHTADDCPAEAILVSESVDDGSSESGPE